MDTDRQTDRHTKTGDYFFRTFGVMKRRENEGSMSQEVNVEEYDSPDSPMINIGEILLNGK